MNGIVAHTSTQNSIKIWKHTSTLCNQDTCIYSSSLMWLHLQELKNKDEKIMELQQKLVI
jgi:hypothetical protein